MNAEAKRHLKALDSLIAIHHADTGQEAVKALAGIIRNLEAEAATATAKLETAQTQAADLGDEAIRRGVEIQRLASVRDSLNHQLLASEERNKTQAEYLDKLRKAIGSNDWHDLDKLVADVTVLKQERDEWRKVAVDRAKTRDQRGKHFTEAQQQSQPQPLPCHTLQTHQPDPLEEAEHERRKLVTELGAKMAELNAAEEEIRSLRAERDRYAKIIDRL